MPDTYTLRIYHGSLRTVPNYSSSIGGADARLEGQMELITPIAKYLPDMSMVYSVHDTPLVILGWDHKIDLLEHVEEGECELLTYNALVRIFTSLGGESP
jgi:hypothetical protein